MKSAAAVLALLGLARSEYTGTDIDAYLKMSPMERVLDLQKRRAEGNVHSDAFKTMQELANQAGFKCESYNVVTDDGYILTVYRIPGKLTSELTATPGPPVLMQHAL